MDKNDHYKNISIYETIEVKRNIDTYYMYFQVALFLLNKHFDDRACFTLMNFPDIIVTLY